MHPNHRQAASRLLRVALLVVALPAAWGAWATLHPAASPPHDTPSHAVTVTALPAELAAIRPAGVDGTPPPIQAAELWPAQ